MYIQTLIQVLLLMCSMAVVSSAQTYRHQLHDEWTKAEETVCLRHESWESVFSSLETDSSVCVAVVFPEILRWSKLKDIFEQAALKDRYVKEGTKGADFSIGLFQMKPSFAEKVEAAWMESNMCHKYGLYFDLQDTNEARRRRISRLSDENWQCVYLAVFIHIMHERVPAVAAMTAEEQVSILATAYNRDLEAPLSSLVRWSETPTFHLDIIPTKNTQYYIYAAIASEWFSMNHSEGSPIELISRSSSTVKSP